MGLNVKPTIAPQVEAPAQPEATLETTPSPEATPIPAPKAQPEATPSDKETPKDAPETGATGATGTKLVVSYNGLTIASVTR